MPSNGLAREPRADNLLCCCDPRPPRRVATSPPGMTSSTVSSGRGIYFGDHKPQTTVPLGQTPGNRAMTAAWSLHRSSDRSDRLAAAPLLVFRGTERITGAGAVERKGAVSFLGVARLRNATTISADHADLTYRNMMFELEFIAPNDATGTFDWTWVNMRRDPSIDLEECLSRAPRAWASWVESAT
jgi:hypothetical protein